MVVRGLRLPSLLSALWLGAMLYQQKPGINHNAHRIQPPVVLDDPFFHPLHSDEEQPLPDPMANNPQAPASAKCHAPPA